ncbi:serine hydrolase domain-containing protein [Mycobacterium sp. ACS4331]|uniref:serine hydrolase domain-containing protein n=1 Tax=Mycobacterium sp. ACS4331 TaxID=1834121 RepID=UPI0008019AC1|nr:serine hydrolase domain-containing protein [Mycobacterium sp. ACS4331]OBF30450.1 D-alanyl-D-alanine carboxypeptidase [Mycobacterium sp. ACS4331]
MKIVRCMLLACAVALSGVTAAGCTARAPEALNRLDAAEFQQAVAKAADGLHVPGALVLLRTPHGTYTAAVGTTQLDLDSPPSPDTHFRIASNTKTMTAALTMLLAQDGALRLDDPISDYVPNVPNGASITLSDLLKMRSGLYCYTNDPKMSARLDADPEKAWTPQQALDIAFAHPPNARPDTEYEYCNTNYALLGLAAERAGRRPLARQFESRLFEPVELSHTSLPAADDTALPTPYSHGYMYGKTLYAMVDEDYPAAMAAAAESGRLEPIDYTHQNPSYATAAGGAISTANDLATWMRALVTGGVLDPDHQRQWLDSLQPEDPHDPDGKRYGYGISHQRFGPNAAMYYHGGEMPGFNSFMGHDPDNDVTLVIWTNLTLSPDGQTTANALLPSVLKEVYADLDF